MTSVTHLSLPRQPVYLFQACSRDTPLEYAIVLLGVDIEWLLVDWSVVLDLIYGQFWLALVLGGCGVGCDLSLLLDEEAMGGSRSRRWVGGGVSGEGVLLLLLGGEELVKMLLLFYKD